MPRAIATSSGGMAQGCDLYFCQCALALRQQHPDVTVEAATRAPPRRTPGPLSSGGSIKSWWRPAILKRWSLSGIPPRACSEGTGIWWITPRC